MDPETRFSEDEVQKILAKAAKSQQREESTLEEATSGLSLTRLQQVAADVGIAPVHIEAAAREILVRRQSAPAGTIVGLPRELGTLRVAPGVVSDAQWEKIVAELRQIFGKSGIPSQFGALREWVSTNDRSESMPVCLRLTPDEAGTRITLRQSVTAMSSLIWGVGGGLAGVAVLIGVLMAIVGFEPAVAGAPAMLGGIGVLSAGVGWIGGKSWSKQQQERLERAADRAELIVRGAGVEMERPA